MGWKHAASILLAALLASCTSEVEPLTPAQRQAVAEYIRQTAPTPTHRLDAAIIPGILPIENWQNARRFSLACGANVPQWMDDLFDKAIRDNRHDLLATALATELCSKLMEGGVEDLHFYTLNRPELTRDICHALGVTPRIELRHVA